ncbi:hypothetical protein PIB30_034219 [Stylosanthes scabra]|uniref:Uncharacterized protein n=1 Tax=Stylosanthes scabra TaxID=79078 RepID=A0ABU6TDF7_9FABA|nr:hypothetical protein [Stylosanthes scabra]
MVEARIDASFHAYAWDSGQKCFKTPFLAPQAFFLHFSLALAGFLYFRAFATLASLEIQRCALLLDLEPSTPDFVLYKLVHGLRLAFVLLIHKLISCSPCYVILPILLRWLASICKWYGFPGFRFVNSWFCSGVASNWLSEPLSLCISLSTAKALVRVTVPSSAVLADCGINWGEAATFSLG